MKKYIEEIGLFLTAIVWGMGFVGTKLSLDGGLTPLQLITIRFLIASIFINLIFNFSNKKLIVSNRHKYEAGEIRKEGLIFIADENQRDLNKRSSIFLLFEGCQENQNLHFT